VDLGGMLRRLFSPPPPKGKED